MWGAIALAAASVLSGVGQVMQNKQAAQEQKRAQRAQTAMEIERNRREAMNVRRQAYIRSAAIQAAASNTLGSTGGSGVAGAVGSIGSMAGSAIGQQGMEAQGAKNLSRMSQRAVDSQSKAEAWGAASDLFGKWSDRAWGAYMQGKE